MNVRSNTFALIGATAIALGSTAVGHAQDSNGDMSVTASLTPSAEVPAVKSDASGSLTGTYDPKTMMLNFKVVYKGLSGPATMAHFHAPAPTGKDGPVEIPIKGSVASPITGDIKLTPDQAKNMTDGMTYFNVHTGANPGGEIRGQVLVK